MEFITLRNGVRMPILGYGVYQIPQDICERCVLDALQVGYRSLDTAQSYFNEEQVGSAIEKSGIPRKEIFLTTKVWIEHYGYEQAKASVLESMEKLRTDYLDLVLLHQPFADYYGAYRALEDLYEAGKLRAIGISNFYPDRMVDIASFARIRPLVNQIEVHPLHQQAEAKQWLDKYGIQMEAWAPFGEGRGGLFTNPALTQIGAKYGKTAAQVMLRWHIQLGIAVIPKSTHIERMRENLEVFDFALTREDMAAVAALDQRQSAFFSHQDPAMVEWFVKMVEERKSSMTAQRSKKAGNAKKERLTPFLFAYSQALFSRPMSSSLPVPFSAEKGTRMSSSVSSSVSRMRARAGSTWLRFSLSILLATMISGQPDSRNQLCMTRSFSVGLWRVSTISTPAVMASAPS